MPFLFFLHIRSPMVDSMSYDRAFAARVTTIFTTVFLIFLSFYGGITQL